MAAGSRREAREQALSLLYEAEMKSVDPSAVIAELPVPADLLTEELVSGVAGQRADLDNLVASFSRDWPLERLASIDRCILEMAAYELRNRPDVPTAVVISEAVELAKRYSTEESGRFVNGVLAAIAPAVRA